MPWINPKTDWEVNPTNPVAADFNRIEGNIDFLNTDIEAKKGAIVDALNSVGIATLIADTHVQIASKITSAKKTGISITPSTVNQAIPKGIYDTGGGVVVGDPDLISANIKAGINIFGVVGNVNVVDTSAGDATAAQILSGKKAYVDGVLVTGNIPSKAAATITPGTANQVINAGQYLSGAQTILGDADLVAGNIKSGVNIFGVTGIVDQSVDLSKLTVQCANSNSSITLGNTPKKVMSTAGSTSNAFLIAVYILDFNDIFTSTKNFMVFKNATVSNIGTSFTTNSSGWWFILNPTKATITLKAGGSGYSDFYEYII